MKKLLLLLVVFTLFTSCIINNPQPEECEVVEITVTEITKGTSNDIVIKDNGTDFYYINRGLEKELSIEDLNKILLNKKVTLHLPKYWIGTSEYIAQITLDDAVVYTEFY